MDEAALARCQEIIGYRFSDLDLLRQCLTHASAASRRVVSNERLEFLGDAVLGMVICEAIYTQQPELLEGEMTKIKSIFPSGSFGSVTSPSMVSTFSSPQRSQRFSRYWRAAASISSA